MPTDQAADHPLIRTVRNSLFTDMIAGVCDQTAPFDRTSGRFLAPNGGWAVTHQDRIYPLALMALEQRRDNPHYGSDELMDMVLAGGDCLRSFQYPDGTVEFVKVDGSRWGAIYMPWTMYHWLETYALLIGVVGNNRLAPWREGLELAFAGIDRQLKQASVHNIPTWNAMSLSRAGMLFEQPTRIETADEAVQRTLDGQDPAGFWPEHGGPTTSYNQIYNHALGLYYLHGGTVDVRPALSRALDFHLTFTYPDGSLVETIDGRVRYRSERSPVGFPGYMLFPRGVEYIAALVERPAFTRRECSPHHADTYRYLDPEQIPTACDDESMGRTLHQTAYTVERAGAAVCRNRNWYGCLSGITTAQTDSRWGMDRAFALSLWHKRTGLLVGGGNSKSQPDWGTFVIRHPDRTVYIPTSGAVKPTACSLTLEYADGAVGQIRLEFISQRTVRLHITCCSPADADAACHLPLRLSLGQQLKTASGEHYTLEESELQLHQTSAGAWLAGLHWRLSASGPWQLLWPSVPFNPYHKEGKADYAQALGLLILPLSGREAEQVVTLTIVDP